ncbi:hypothetical protein V6N12_022336 [Hibiscus sabdariffa]|uniref:Uncharacterized protein n=1 Tax=Hibiscus sabdariffa TaxID=183260 RepID=A0ABR2FUE6_9ROSI
MWSFPECREAIGIGEWNGTSCKWKEGLVCCLVDSLATRFGITASESLPHCQLPIANCKRIPLFLLLSYIPSSDDA